MQLDQQHAAFVIRLIDKSLEHLMNTDANPVAASASNSRDNPCYGSNPTVATRNACADDE